MIPLFKERRRKLTLFKAMRPKPEKLPNRIPEGLYTRCPDCKQDFVTDQIAAGFYVCPGCGYHMKLTAQGRLKLVIDKGSLRELNAGLVTLECLDFPGYSEKLSNLQSSTGLKDAVVTGFCTIEGHSAVIAVMDSRFMMGSMGSVVGEKISRAFEYATKKRLPVIIFSASGGARMQEGIISLIQMAKTSNALARHHQAGLLYISCLTNPTTGGVTASFASLGDIIIAEPRALIGFAGPRVIEQTIHQTLPQGFQRSEFLLEHGFIDQIVERPRLRSTLATLLRLHSVTAQKKGGG
ncbi:MAG: acetyl-CoA carboxylase, carboxyltransferase subunit beta [Oscillospiraceae bacterium]|nr:acetyl-CoA carboxylase, carboxyltransferase subunit beta [Oscillospiraceae bacterium]MDD4413604.1 acetyl-CoA carboxylase, carboxyltransferase subunit beta [Oscillospiraceae bacterium]